MKKKVLEGWVTVRKKGGRLTSFEDDNFVLFGRKRGGVEWWYCDDEDVIVKVKVTIEPA